MARYEYSLNEMRKDQMSKRQRWRRTQNCVQWTNHTKHSEGIKTGILQEFISSRTEDISTDITRTRELSKGKQNIQPRNKSKTE